MFTEIVLILTLMTPPGQEDIQHHQKMDDLLTCYAAAQEFTNVGLSDAMRQHGIIGKAAACAVVERPSQDE